MSPYETAYQWFCEHPQQESFSWYCGWHMQHAFLYSTPDFFICGRPAVKQSLENIGPTFAHERYPDCWFIHFLSGDVGKAWTILPYYLPFVAFQRLRRNQLELVIVQTDRLRNVSELVT